ncbi:sporulene cyclase [Scopulibacillus darangshiensis]|uniref:Sporulene cyclase n=1 Tax=Scopulibacillus darangshiensis TaxID=442528 RepID=A0A4R2NF56_9BACL|nr:prenyltransferase/squalene oxidase repeat-containing protein [Scopulibacillus darangshiensis]TCP19745.1 sporulene cyclase [Scopulibacillus darangshiensis]
MVQSSRLEKVIQDRCDNLLQMQHSDGSWRFCFEGSTITDAYMIILVRVLDIQNETLVKGLVHRLVTKQQANGAWKVFPDEAKGNLSATIENYAALLYSGYKNAADPMMKKAAAFVRARGGLKKAGLLTKAFLAMNGQYPWPRLPFDPAIFVLFPSYFPVNFYDFSSYARAHFAPVLLANQTRFSIKKNATPNLDALYTRDQAYGDDYWPELTFLSSDLRSIYSTIKETLMTLKNLPQQLQNKSTQWLEQYLLSHIEPNGTLLSYASSTFFMIYALLSIGYGKDSSVIQQAIKGLLSNVFYRDKTLHVQNSPSPVWDTALITDTLIQAGVSKNNEQIRSAADYLLNKQQEKFGDWAFHNPNVKPGGWGFSASDRIHPDIDDTHAALAVIGKYKEEPNFGASYKRGMTWLLSMQNKDGGWPAFEKGTDNLLLAMLPIKNIRNAAIDPSTPDLTGRTLEFLGNIDGQSYKKISFRDAVRWLKHHQEDDGSWYGRWGVCYIYGTWAALTGLRATGVPVNNYMAEKGVRFLQDIQHDDDGWGESCYSDTLRSYVPLKYSTAVQTAWAVDALVSCADQPTDSIQRGIDYLLNDENYKGLSGSYPVGAGLPGSFYIKYHSYPYIWPLLTLAHYKGV